MAAETGDIPADAPRTLLCVGAGRVGAVTTMVIASKCPWIRCEIFDDNMDLVRKWASGVCPFYEPGLKELLDKVLNRNLFFTHDLVAAIQKSELIFVCLNTPTKTYGEGAGSAPDLSGWENVARRISKYANGDKIVVESSTIPVKLGESMRRILSTNVGGYKMHVVCMPSFIRGSMAVSDFESPQRILIGGYADEDGADRVAAIFKGWLPPDCKVLKTNMWSAELSKLALNAYKACRISSTNAVPSSLPVL